MTDIARPRFARMYLRSAPSAEERGATDHRRRLLEGLSGMVVEIGAGHGLNFPHYPPDVTEVIAIEPEPTLRSQAEKAAEQAAVPIRVFGGVADELPLADASADAAVTSLVLCSVPDQQHALAEIRRVLRPGGELRFYEHVIPRCQPKRLLLQAIDRSGLWPAIAGGCHPARDTTEAIMRAGFRHRGDRALRLLGCSLRAPDPAHPRDGPQRLSASLSRSGARSPDEVETRRRVAAIEERANAVRINPRQVHQQLGLGDPAGLMCESDQSDEPPSLHADEDVDLFSVVCGRGRDMAVVGGVDHVRVEGVRVPARPFDDDPAVVDQLLPA
jgi:ubiquinone/menaquinone biosynthesis C-methylase UbiE